MTKKLSSRAVEALKPDPNRRLEVADASFSGLYLVIQPSGAKSWALRYRHAGKTRKLTIGKWPAVGVAAARSKAGEAIEQIELGHDPAAEKQARKAALVDEAERDRFGHLFDVYTERKLAKLKAGETPRLVLAKHVLPYWQDRSIKELTRRDVIERLDDIVAAGRAPTANRVRSYLSAFFAWAIEREIVDLNPVSGTRKPAREVSRDRVLTDDEIRWLWRAAEEEGPPFGSLVQLLLLTGQRRAEVAGMTHREVKGDTWYLAASRTKNGRPHTVPLTEPALTVLGSVRRIKGGPAYVFTTTGASPISGFTKMRARLVRRMHEIGEEEVGKLVEIPPFTLHDLRRTCTTGMARLGISVTTTEHVLNHSSGTTSGIVSVYQRHDHQLEKRAALDRWGRFVMDLVEVRSAQVVELEATR